LLIIAAPIKRPYIWDLAPSVSAIHHCLQQGLHVYLLEWMPGSHRIANNGLDDYTLAISDCVATISRKTSGTKSSLIGHSLGDSRMTTGSWSSGSNDSGAPSSTRP
jgi:polyhydroxyalkanoate synthase